MDTTWNKECRITPSILLKRDMSSLAKKFELKKTINATIKEKNNINLKYKLNSSSNFIFWSVICLLIIYLLIKKIGAEKNEDFDKRDN
jgi:hypothetical protein